MPMGPLARAWPEGHESRTSARRPLGPLAGRRRGHFKPRASGKADCSLGQLVLGVDTADQPGNGVATDEVADGHRDVEGVGGELCVVD